MRQVAINMVHELARRDPRVLFIGSDLGAGTLKAMKAEMPERFFMEGIAEQHVIGMAAGLAMEGFVPYINTIATFLTRRCFEQIAIDVCLENLPVRLIASGGGVVYAPLGPTHIALDDIALMRALPNMAIVAPCDAEEMARLMQAGIDWPGPLYIRLAKGGDPVISSADAGFAIGRSILMRPEGEVLLLGTGVSTGIALAAADLLAAAGVGARVLHAHTVKPFDVDGLVAAAKDCRMVATIEEHSRVGGLGSAVLECLSDLKVAIPVVRLGFPDRFAEGYGSQAHLLEKAGLTPDALAQAVLGALAIREALA
jgi:transketolase